MAQSLNFEAFFYFTYTRFFNKSLAIPHFSIQDISKICPIKLKQHGFKGLIFDKDNTLTAPYKNHIFPSISAPFKEFQSVFGDNIIIISNSAGTTDDKDYKNAAIIEHELGIKVLRHNRKKPAKINEIFKHFNCSSEELVMFGDRIFTDVVFGNRHGFLTIHTALLTSEGDNKLASIIRCYELSLLREWLKCGITPPHHNNSHPDICLESLF